MLIIAISSCRPKNKPAAEPSGQEEFPSELINFKPSDLNPVFKGTGTDTWDNSIRERGFILYDEGIYKMWYSGLTKKDFKQINLGYATSPDGLNWTRHSGNPIFSERWTEDMFVVKNNGTYYMYAEGLNDVAHLLVSQDGIKWEDKGDLIIRTTDGEPIPGPYGTPNVWIENGKWYLFYERNDEGIWLAVSDDKIDWTNVQDDPVILKGPEKYDAGAVAANQVIKYKERYYIYYHATTNPDWTNPSNIWTSEVAMSEDLIHWKKYPGNPIVKDDHSSPILVPDGGQYRLYTMHPEVWVYFSE